MDCTKGRNEADSSEGCGSRCLRNLNAFTGYGCGACGGRGASVAGLSSRCGCTKGGLAVQGLFRLSKAPASTFCSTTFETERGVLSFPTTISSPSRELQNSRNSSGLSFSSPSHAPRSPVGDFKRGNPAPPFPAPAPRGVLPADGVCGLRVGAVAGRGLRTAAATSDLGILGDGAFSCSFANTYLLFNGDCASVAPRGFQTSLNLPNPQCPDFCSEGELGC